MDVKKLMVAVAVFAAAGSAFAQQTEFVAPDASFKSTLTRGEVRQDLTQPGQAGAAAAHGPGPVYAKGQRSRAEVRAEAIQSAQSRRAGDVNNLYFGA
jgi:hypothetical protein